MTKKRTNNLYNIDHRTYGGEITLFDFEGHHTLSSMAEKIARDKRFDEYCIKKSIKNKNKKGELK